jgi:hydroxymethylglutaryl-CoA lyase
LSSNAPDKNRIFIQEVAPRDGFQNEPSFIPTAAKIALINRLSYLGLAKIEVTSFTSPKAIPALADAEAVMAGINRVPGVCYTALVPNARGAERAIASCVDEFNVVMSVSEAHNLTNLRATRDQSAAGVVETARLALVAGVPVNVSLSCVFGCPMEGDVDSQHALSWAARFVDEGVAGITLCDTTGMAYPSLVASVVQQFKSRWPKVPLTLHFHNSRGMGLANVCAATQSGADRFDTALGGIGGCPYAPGATGNICTEDTVHMLGLMGFDTGVDSSGLLRCAAELPLLVGHDVPSQLLKAGIRLKRHALPASFDDIRTRALARRPPPFH